jgi:hypothetical protein
VKSRAWLFAAALVIAIAGIVLYRKRSELREAPAPHVQATPSAPSAGSAAGAAAPAHVTRFASPADRQGVADRIASARAVRAQQTPRPPPRLPGEPATSDSGDPGDTSHDLERVGPKLKAALEEAIPLLAACYQTGSVQVRRAAVSLTLTADPEIGTLIGADQLVDPDGKPLDAELDSCLRTTFRSLLLPPLDATRDLHMQYSFRFDD